MLSRYDRIVFSLIALALAVIAMNPWIAPGYVSARGKAMDVRIADVSALADPIKVNIAAIGGETIILPRLKRPLSGVPAIVLNVNDLRK